MQVQAHGVRRLTAPQLVRRMAPSHAGVRGESGMMLTWLGRSVGPLGPSDRQ
jgi:hypothetical protein